MKIRRTGTPLVHRPLHCGSYMVVVGSGKDSKGFWILYYCQTCGATKIKRPEW